VAKIATGKKMNPALTAPLCNVNLVSEGSIGETVEPSSTIGSTCGDHQRRERDQRAAARQRLVRESRMTSFGADGFFKTGNLTDRFGLICVLVQPLFMKRMGPGARRQAKVQTTGLRT